MWSIIFQITYTPGEKLPGLYAVYYTLQRGLALHKDGEPVGWAAGAWGSGGAVKWHIASSLEAINTPLTVGTYVHTSTYIHTYKNICPNQTQKEAFPRNRICFWNTTVKQKSFLSSSALIWIRLNSAPVLRTVPHRTCKAGEAGGRELKFSLGSCDNIGSDDTCKNCIFT